jgi:hypothetical protein
MNYFLVIFIDFFYFLNSNLNFVTGCYRWVPLPYPSGSSGTAVYRAVTTGKKTLGGGRFAAHVCFFFCQKRKKNAAPNV